jgi:malate permease and related proteins
MNQVNDAFLVTLALIMVGYCLKRMNIINENDGKILSKFFMHTTFPALVLLSFWRVRIEPQLLLVPCMGLAFGSTLVGIGWLVFRNYPTKLRGMLTMGAGGMNTMLFGLPIVEAIWGRDVLAYLVMFDIGNTVVSFCVSYPIGNYLSMSGQSTGIAKKIFNKVIRLMPFQAMIIGLIFNALHIALPDLATTFLETLAKGNKPIVLILMGIYLRFVVEKQQILAVSKVLWIRYLTGLLVAGLLYALMPPSAGRSVLMICVILPAGLTLLPFSNELNYDANIAAMIINWSLIISFLLMWILVLGLQLA